MPLDNIDTLAHMVHLKTSNEALKIDKTVLEDRITVLEKCLSDKDMIITSLKERIRKMELTINSMSLEIDSLKKK